MARTSRDLKLTVHPNDAYMLALHSGAQIPSFSIMRQDPARFRVDFHRGFGWSNPIDVSVTAWQSGEFETTLRYEASILALADPFGFMDKNLDRFEQHLRAHHEAWLTGGTPPPAPADSHSVKVNLIILGVFFGLFALVIVVVLLGIVFG
jgi:hypothetical protein